MKISHYAIESRVEETHWWFVVRRKLLGNIVSKLKLSTKASILDVGTGTGSNLRLLKNLGFEHISGVDNSDEAVRFCAEKSLGIVQKGDICNLPFENNSFDLVLATDVIEHIDDDVKAVSELKRVLKPQGYMVIMVPAFQCLWGLQDEVSYHKRRYKLEQIQSLSKENLKCERIFYFNYLLFMPIWLARKIINIFNIPLESESQINNRLINYLLTFIFTLDIITAPLLKPSFGVSIFALAKKTVSS